MKIKKLSEDKYKQIKLAVKAHISAWYKIPKDLDLDNLNTVRVRYVKKWSEIPKDYSAYIIEIRTRTNYYKLILSESELVDNREFHVNLITEQSVTGVDFAKTLLCSDLWYEYPVIYGELDENFDNVIHYLAEGMYCADNYLEFESLYE